MNGKLGRVSFQERKKEEKITAEYKVQKVIKRVNKIVSRKVMKSERKKRVKIKFKNFIDE